MKSRSDDGVTVSDQPKKRVVFSAYPLPRFIRAGIGPGREGKPIELRQVDPPWVTRLGASVSTQREPSGQGAEVVDAAKALSPSPTAPAQASTGAGAGWANA